MSDAADSLSSSPLGPTLPPNATSPPSHASSPPSITDDTAPPVEQLRLHLREVFVYAVPRLVSSTGYRAEDLNLPNPLLTGYLKAFQRGDTDMFLRIFQPDHTLFAECPIHVLPGKKDPLGSFFIPVVDSSRYFVVKAVDRRRHAFIAIGFRERSDAFDLKALLEDLVTYNARAELARRRTQALDSRAGRPDDGSGREETGDVMGTEDGKEGKDGANGSFLPVFQDLSLKEGETLKLNLVHALEKKEGEGERKEVGRRKHRAGSSELYPGESVRPPSLLPLPPKAMPRRPTDLSVPATQVPVEVPEEEWGDFVGRAEGDGGGQEEQTV